MSEKKTWSKVVRELLAMHETFRRLKFPSDELFVHLYPINNTVQFVLDHAGKTFAIDVAMFVDLEAVRKEWLEALEWWNDTNIPNGERQAVYVFSDFSTRHMDLVQALTKKGLL